MKSSKIRSSILYSNFSLLFILLIISMIFVPSCKDEEFPPVNANFNADKNSVLVNSPVVFTDLSTGDPITWEWTFEGGTPSSTTGQNPTVTYSQSGIYDVTLKALNAGNSDTEIKTDFIEVIGEASVEFNGDKTLIVVGDSIDFTDLSTGNPNSWNWTFFGGTPSSSTLQNQTATYSETGLYDVTLEIMNELSSDTRTKTNFIEVLPMVSVDFDANTSIIIAGGQVDFNDLSTGNPNSWNWTFDGGDPSTSDMQNPTVTYNQTGLYNVTFVSANEVSSDTIVKSNFISVFPQVVSDFTMTDTLINQFNSITFTDISTGDPTAWEWSFEGGTPSTSTEQNPTVTYSEGGIFDVALRTSNPASTNLITKEDTVVVIPTENMAAYYPFNGDANDLSGNGYDGVINGATLSTNRNGKNNTAIDFDGFSSNVDLGDILDDVFTGPDKQFSISLWIRPSISMTNNLIIAKLGDSGCGEEQREFTIRVLDDKINFLLFNSLLTGSFRRIQSSTSLTINNWHHIVLNYNGSLDSNNGLDRVTIYVNNIQESLSLTGSEGGLGSIQDGTAHLGLGNRLDSNGSNCGNDRAFTGGIDDVRIYNQILNVAEIEALFNE